MRRTPVVLGVLAIVFGGLVALWSGFSLAMQGVSGNMLSEMKMPTMPGQPDPSLMMKRIAEVNKELMPVYYTDRGGMIALSLVVLVIGIGLVRRQGWSRRASVLWAIVALLFIPVRLYLEAGIVLPKM